MIYRLSKEEKLQSVVKARVKTIKEIEKIGFHVLYVGDSIQIIHPVKNRKIQYNSKHFYFKQVENKVDKWYLNHYFYNDIDGSEGYREIWRPYRDIHKLSSDCNVYKEMLELTISIFDNEDFEI